MDRFLEGWQYARLAIRMALIDTVKAVILRDAVFLGVGHVNVHEQHLESIPGHD